MIELLFEAFLVALMASAGVALARSFGLREPVLLAAVGFALVIVIRVATFFSLLAVSAPVDSKTAWIVVSSVIALSGVFVFGRQSRFWVALGYGAGIGVIALVAKFLFGIGERFHEDSAQIVANALLIFSADEISSNEKRGLALPLMLALGHDSHIFMSFVPMVFGHLLLITIWFARRLTKHHLSLVTFLMIGGLLAAVSISTPMVRVLPFYLNSHTLVALGVGIVVVAHLQSLTSLHFRRTEATLLASGGLLIVLSRVEGIGIFLVLAVTFFTSQHIRTRTAKGSLWFATQIPVWAWYVWIHSSGVSIPYFQKDGVVLIPLSVGVLSGLVLWRRLEWLRAWTMPLLTASLFIFAMYFISQSTGNVPGQLRNLVLGLGGWGFVAPAFVLLTVLLMSTKNSRQYRALMQLVFLGILGTIVLKFFDGSLGQQGFNDSINRAWSHWLVLWWWVPILGLGELWARMRAGNQVARDSEVRT